MLIGICFNLSTLLFSIAGSPHENKTNKKLSVTINNLFIFYFSLVSLGG